MEHQELAVRRGLRGIDHRAAPSRRAYQPPQDRLGVAHRCAWAEALHVVMREQGQAAEHAHQVHSAVRSRESVDFVNDD